MPTQALLASTEIPTPTAVLTPMEIPASTEVPTPTAVPTPMEIPASTEEI